MHTCISRVLWHLHLSAASIPDGSLAFHFKLAKDSALSPVSKQGQCNIPFIRESYYGQHYICSISPIAARPPQGLDRANAKFPNVKSVRRKPIPG